MEGLDIWLRLDLISHAQVRRLSQTYLSCPLPHPVIATPKPVPEVTASPVSSLPSKPDPPLVPTPSPSPLSQIWHSLKDELSVRWLLFLGVFLVVVSSGVLAATQWQNFPAAAQYAVLWTYTIVFSFGSVWAGRQRSLQLTARTLRLITLLLVPVNFWAMDSFGLGRHPGEWVVVAIAAFTLSAVTVIHPEMRNHSSRFVSFASLLLWLSYLHWGWQWSSFPLVAVYLGMVGTALFLPTRYASPRIGTREEDTETRRRGDAGNYPLSPSGRLPLWASSTSLFEYQQDIQLDPRTGSSIVIYALTVLLGRAIFVKELPIEQLGLAIGICGWLFARLGQLPETLSKSAPSFQSKIWERLGGVLLLIGWLVSVGETIPWQATAVSGLGLWFFASRLQRFWWRGDLLTLFIIGLQAHWLVWRLIPSGWQQSIITFSTQLTNSQNVPGALLSFALFPYVIGMVVLTDWLYRASKSKLARFGEQLAFGFGLVLTFISLFNPTLRSLNLFFSTVTLATVTSRWSPTRTGLVYLTHITGLLALASTIDWLFPNLNQPIWAIILLVGMVLEWSYSLLPQPPIWQHSAWHLGFVLSGLSYALLWNQIYPYGIINNSVNQQSQLVWLLTPLALTGVATWTDVPRRRQASWLSVAALGMAQLLTLLLPGVRLIGLSFATGLMLVNTRYLRHKAAAIITVGFALSFVGTLFWEGIPGLPKLSVSDWFLVGAIAILVLWLLRSLLRQRPGTLPALYAEACDNWAVALCGVELLLLTVHCLLSYLELVSADWEYLTASTVIGSAIAFRCWQQPTDTAVYGISWAIELLIAEAIVLANGSVLALATATIILGLVTLFVSDGWLALHPRRPIPLRSIESLPLLYALLGFGLRWGYFNGWTGLLTLGAALTGVGVGRRREAWKPLTYLSLAGISVAWYELVLYQMLQATGGSSADAFTILAGVATAIAFAYRLLAWFWESRTEEPFLSLSVAEIKTTAHIHWFIGSFLMVIAGAIAINADALPRLAGIAITLCLLLATYALMQGRRNADYNAANIWVYIGCFELVATVVFARLVWNELSVLDAWFPLIACGVACVTYELPWQRWGWIKTPWKRSAVLLPIFTVCATTEVISDISLLLVAGFYAWIAQRSSNIRFTYISVVLVDWAIGRWLERLQLTDDPLWYASLFGLSLLYMAQFDPHLKQREQRESRHYLRILGSGIICGVALLFHQDTGLIPAIIGAIAIFAGLILRVRAFLFVGTATFLLTAFYQLVILIFEYPFIKWVVGLIAGIIFIAMAANFETRREQIASVLRSSRNELDTWE